MTSALEQAAERQLADTIGEAGITYWKAPPDMSFDEWQRVGNTLQVISGSINWWIGDWLNEGERRWGEMYAQAVECTGWDYERLRIAKYVSANVDLLIRINNLSWTHHRYVAALPDSKQAAWLKTAKEFGWSSRQLREAIKQSEQPIAPSLSGDGHIPEPLPSGFDEPADYMSALYGEDTPDSPQDDLGERTPPKSVHVSHNSGDNEWYTPEAYIEAARAVLGEIDLDPASTEEANTVVNATRFYSRENDGLTHEWRGSVWMNPPYAGDLVGRFTGKLVHHYCNGDVSEAIVLVNNATETGWFTWMIAVAAAVVFPERRVKFWKPTGEKGAPLQGQAIIYFGKKTREFLNAFKPFGWGALIDG